MQNNNMGIKKTNNNNNNKLKFGDDVSTLNLNGEVIPISFINYWHL